MAPPFLTSALDGAEWSGSHPGRFIPKERARGTHWIRGWVGRRVGLGAVEKRRIPFPYRGIGPRLSSPKPVATPIELSRLRSLNMGLC
jgi:hypothetical protein